MKKRKPRAIVLTKAACRPIMKAAFERGNLQVQKDAGSLRFEYSGPCVIGVCLTAHQRKRLDNSEDIDGVYDTNIGTLINAGLVKTDDDEWFIRRQGAHDGGDVIRLRRLLGARNPQP